MVDFLEKFPVLIDYLLAGESHSAIDQPCSCAATRPGALRKILCFDCSYFEPCCSDCFLESHRNCPTHWAHRWKGQSFDKVDISELGYVFTFSHAHGAQRCPNGDYGDKKPLNFILVDTNGVHQTKAVFCACANHGKPEDRFTELLHCRIFPATVARPETGFTFGLLEDFHLQTLTSKKSPYDYIAAIRRKTCNAGPDLHEVPNPYVQFLRVQRVFRAVTAIKRGGQVHGIDRFFLNRPPGSVVVPCFVCPEPGFNVPDRYWIDIHEDFIHLVQLALMLDGHFGLQRFGKVDDPDDVSLLKGKGLFPLDELYNEYVRDVVANEEEASHKSSCSNFNAVEMQNRLKFRGCVISGVIAVECGRHCIFLSMVDLQKGERFANADYALMIALRRFMSSSLDRVKFFKRFITTYDVACQFEVHFGERIFKSFPDLAPIVDLINFLVPKMHLDGHKDKCKYRFTLNYFQGAGRTHGEGIEQSWAESKQSGGSSRQMNHGHRHDTIIDFHNFWNWVKFELMEDYLESHLIDARVSLQGAIDHFFGLSISRGKENVVAWSKLSTEPRKVGSDWESVYRFLVPSREAVYLSLVQSETKRSEAEEIVMKTQSVETQFLNTGLKLQERHRRYLQRFKKSANTDSEQTTLARSRAALLGDLRQWRKTQLQIMPTLERLALESRLESAEVFVEREILYLPSDFNSTDRVKLGLQRLADLELRLREGEANDAVLALCDTIAHKMVLREVKKSNARGVTQNTRATKFIRGVEFKRAGHAAQYRKAREAVLELQNVKESANYPVLTEEDMYAKNAVNARELGDGSKTDGWIWRYGNLKGLDKDERDAFVIESKFRVSELGNTSDRLFQRSVSNGSVPRQTWNVGWRKSKHWKKSSDALSGPVDP
ncbi:hypothetical protein CPB85DRAFT_1219841 [Mucidula mucida]|nr:hypothetical protein CPB85DRAFT_1219841 [Mucidula mucida]